MTLLQNTGALAETYDIAIVGAGPAGMAAAVTARAHGLSVVVLDRGFAAGGQIYRSLGNSPLAGRRDLLGPDYWKGEALLRDFLGCGADVLHQASVWYLDASRSLGVSQGGAARIIAPRHVILATGAMERPMPIPGWDLPGVMTAGAAQILLKTSALVGSDAVLVGDGPLLWLLAAQYLAAGAPPKAVITTTPRRRLAQVAGAIPGFLGSSYAAKGLALLWRVRRAVPVLDGSGGVEIHRHAGGLQVRHHGGAGEIGADHVLLHQGVVPEVNLARAAGCPMVWQETSGCWAPRVDAWGNTGLAGIAVAGDGAGIRGAEAAAVAGRLAARDAARALGAITEAVRDAQSAADIRALRRLQRGRAFLDRLYAPSPAQRAGSPEAMACRCEEITGATLLRAVAETGAAGPNQLKAYTRCGMGPCQGRLCGMTVAEVLAQHQGRSPAEVGYFRLRPPVFPLSLAEMASMPVLEDEVSRANRP